MDSKQTPQLNSPLEDACLPDPEEALPDGGLEGDGLGDDDKISNEGSEMHSLQMEDLDMDSDDLLDMLSTVITKDKEEWKTVKGKNKNRKQKKTFNKNGEGKSGYNEDMRNFFEGMENMSHCDTKYVPKRDALPTQKSERVSGKKKMDEVRPPDMAFGVTPFSFIKNHM